MYEGDDGRRYFEYGEGEELQLFAPPASEEGEPIPLSRVRVDGMRFVNGKELFDLTAIDGREEERMEFPYDLEKFEVLLRSGHAEIVKEGEAVELPLSKIEAMQFFKAEREEREAERKKAEKALLAPVKKKTEKGTVEAASEYGELVVRQSALERVLAAQLARGRTADREIERLYLASCKRRKELTVFPFAAPSFRTFGFFSTYLWRIFHV